MYVTKKSEHEISKNLSTWKGNPEGLIRAVISLNDSNKYPLLNGVALYEDTYFNTQQTKELINELKKLRMVLAEQEGLDEINELTKFAETVELGEFLYFCGD